MYKNKLIYKLMMYPLVYRITCSSLVHLISLPLDIKGTSLITNEEYKFQMKELKSILISAIVFSLQNLVFENINLSNNIYIKGGLTGVLTTPLYLFHELHKIIIRSQLKFNNKNKKLVLILGCIRQISMTILLYNFAMLKNVYLGFFSTLIANFYGIILKKHIILIAFPKIKKNSVNIKLCFFLEIFRSSFNDYITFNLLYKLTFSPLFNKNI
tara:strand:- start:12469 stop:13107 length:639 start_codon:yes stop_codon:yes gene_type:complete